MSFVVHRFVLSEHTQDYIQSLIPPFGYNGFGEFIFYRTYSRIKKDGGQETWSDVVIRVINGAMSIRKDWYIKNHILWDEMFWQSYAAKMAVAMFRMEWMPAGRGLWAMGSDFVYERGAMALYNCAYTNISTLEMPEDISWMMDSLMHGVGVGFGPIRDDKMELYMPQGEFDYVIPDTREGWCEATRLQLNAYIRPGQAKPRLIYDQIRGPGLPIKGFGGISSGPQPLMDMHEAITAQCEMFKARKCYDSIYFKVNVANLIGCAVVAGNVRRSAELCKGKITDPVFPDLKNYKKFPERESFGWMSNNSVELESDEDFMRLGEIASRIKLNGEPGFINRRTMPYGRLGKKLGSLRRDMAVGFNPCGEIPLEHREVCNISETLPTMCKDTESWLNACEYSALYMTTVSLLPTHQPSTNRVVARNRRIGASIIDFTGWKLNHGVHQITQFMRDGYKKVVSTAAWANDEAGIPRPIRHTTIKPGGTSPKLPGKTSGIGHPTFDYTKRRVRVAKNSPIHDILTKANIPYEEDYFDKYTDVFEYPILQGPALPAELVSVWEQSMNLILVQREWADNAVSNTIYYKPEWKLIENVDCDFKDSLIHYLGDVGTHQILSGDLEEYLVPKSWKVKIKRNSQGEIIELNIYEYDHSHEEDHIEPVLSMIAPVTKSVSLLPHSAKGAYRQMPEEGITKKEYEERLAAIGDIDWSELSGSDGLDELYCSSESCEIVRK